VRKPDREYWLQNEHYIEQITSQAVGFPVKVYNGDRVSVPGLGQAVGYQIMPAKDDTAPEFFSWHLENNPQWYENPLEAAATFAQALQTYSRRAT
jgi:hypothetical protein